jgi:hypothetical protein
MRRSAILVTSLLTLGIVAMAASCATYRNDLERARAHYDKNEFEPALALFRVLEPDIDSFSTAEYTQYAYTRGMTDYRLSSLVSTGNNSVTDPKAAYRSNARHWLAVARAVENATPGGLQGDEKTRMEEALTDLNRDVFGGGDTVDADAGAPAPAPAAKAATPDK